MPSSGTYDKLVTPQHAALTTAMWRKTATVADVSPARIIDIYFDSTSDDKVDVWFTILDASGVKGGSMLEVQMWSPKPTYMYSITMYWFLHVIDNSLVFCIQKVHRREN